MRSRPDVLVLGGGGVLGEAWMMGVLAGIEDGTGFDLRDCEYYVGTSAGAIVAAHLVAGQSASPPVVDRVRPRASGRATARGRSGRRGARRRPPRRSVGARRRRHVRADGARPGRSRRGGGAGAAAAPAAPARPTRSPGSAGDVERLDPRFDGRLRIAAVDRRNGRRVVFGSPGAPRATVAEAVAASCTVPWLFAPVTIGDREYVDGGVWSPTNLDAAPAGRDTHVLCLNPTANIPASSNVLSVVRSVSRTAVSVEALVLRRRGAAVRMVAPNAECAEVMGTNFMDREPSGRVLAAGYRQGLALVTASAPVASRPPQPLLPLPRP